VPEPACPNRKSRQLASVRNKTPQIPVGSSDGTLLHLASVLSLRVRAAYNANNLHMENREGGAGDKCRGQLACLSDGHSGTEKSSYWVGRAPFGRFSSVELRVTKRNESAIGLSCLRAEQTGESRSLSPLIHWINFHVSQRLKSAS
jgi:hypothetical protein